MIANEKFNKNVGRKINTKILRGGSKHKSVIVYNPQKPKLHPQDYKNLLYVSKNLKETTQHLKKTQQQFEKQQLQKLHNTNTSTNTNTIKNIWTRKKLSPNNNGAKDRQLHFYKTLKNNSLQKRNIMVNRLKSIITNAQSWKKYVNNHINKTSITKKQQQMIDKIKRRLIEAEGINRRLTNKIITTDSGVQYDVGTANT